MCYDSQKPTGASSWVPLSFFTADESKSLILNSQHPALLQHFMLDHISLPSHISPYFPEDSPFKYYSHCIGPCGCYSKSLQTWGLNANIFPCVLEARCLESVSLVQNQGASSHRLPLEHLRKNLFSLFQLLMTVGALGLRLHHPKPCPVVTLYLSSVTVKSPPFLS